MKLILNFLVRASIASLFIAVASAADKFRELLDHLSTGVSIERVAEMEKAKAWGLSGSVSSIMKHSYMAIKPYTVRSANGGAGIAVVRDSFVRKLIADLVDDLKKMGFVINYSHDWPFKEGMSSGRIRLKTKKGDDPALAAMIDVRLFGTSDVSFHVTVAYHIMYLDDPDMIPNLQPQVVPPRVRPAPKSRGEPPATEETEPERDPSVSRQPDETATSVSVFRLCHACGTRCFGGEGGSAATRHASAETAAAKGSAVPHRSFRLTETQMHRNTEIPVSRLTVFSARVKAP